MDPSFLAAVAAIPLAALKEPLRETLVQVVKRVGKKAADKSAAPASNDVTPSVSPSPASDDRRFESREKPDSDVRRSISREIKPEKEKAPKQQRKKTRDGLPTDLVVPDGRTIVISPTFKLVFLTVLFLTVLSAIGNIAVAFGATVPNPNQQTVFDTLNMGWKLGLGAIFGLIGGKAT